VLHIAPLTQYRQHILRFLLVSGMATILLVGGLGVEDYVISGTQKLHNF
jgi:hypothetical protein